MTGALSQRLGLARRELVAFTGAGGKSTLMLRLADELVAIGHRVLVTTTTKMGRDQFTEFPSLCESHDLETVRAALARQPLVALITGGDDHKATGPPPEIVDELFRTAPFDYLLVEADGAHGRSLKAPASHEPVIPLATTTVVVLVGADAVDGRVFDVAHRPEQTAVLTGLKVDERLTVEDCIAVLSHPEGGLKGVPPGARVVVAITKSDEPGRTQAAARMARMLRSHERISGVVLA